MTKRKKFTKEQKEWFRWLLAQTSKDTTIRIALVILREKSPEELYDYNHIKWIDCMGQI
jgi:hypothetical protein